jgi:hypothetical protein
MWPAALPVSQMVMYGIGPLSTGGWFLHDRERGEVIRAQPTSVVPEGFASAIQRLRDAHQRMNVWEGDGWFPFGLSKLVVLAVPDVEVVPSEGADWQPEAWLLRRDVDGIGPHAEFLTADIVSGAAEAALWNTGRGTEARRPIEQAMRRAQQRRGVESGDPDAGDGPS